LRRDSRSELGQLGDPGKVTLGEVLVLHEDDDLVAYPVSTLVTND
jgi:hypothetical protein